MTEALDHSGTSTRDAGASLESRPLRLDESRFRHPGSGRTTSPTPGHSKVGADQSSGPAADRDATTADSSPAEGAPARLSRNLGALAVGQIVTWTMTLIWTLIVPRALGPAGWGLVVSAQGVSGVLTVLLGLGARNYLVREVVLDGRAAAGLIGTVLLVRLSLTPVVALAAVAWVHFAHYGEEEAVVLYLITVMTMLTLLTEPLQAAFQAMERMKYLAYTDIITKVAQSLVGIALVVIGSRVVGIAADMAIIAGIVCALNLVWLRRFLRIDLRTKASSVRSMVWHSSTYWASAFFSYFYFWIDAIMLTLMTRPQIVGWYGATTQLFQTLMFLPSLIAIAWLPRLVDAFRHGERRLVTTARAPLEFILIASVPIAFGTAMVAPVLVPAMFGPAFRPAVPVMIVLACCIPPIYMNIALAQVLIAAKRQAIWTFVMAGAAVVNPLFNLVLIPWAQTRYHDGAIGAAVSLVLTEGLQTIVGLALVGRHVFDRSSARRCALAVLASAAMFAVAYVARPLGAPVSLAAGCVTLLLLAMALPIATPEQVALLNTGFTRVKRAGSKLATKRRLFTQLHTAIGKEAD